MLYRFEKWKSKTRSLTTFRRTKTSNQKPESDLIQAFIAGDDPAFSEIYSRHHAAILKHVSQKVRNEGTAQDLTQEVFLKAFRFRGSYDPKYSLSTWLMTIARNTVTDWSRRPRPEYSATSNDEDSFILEEEIACSEPNAEILLGHHHDNERLSQVLSSLTTLQRKVIQMRIVYELPYREIAKTLGLSVSSVKCLMHRSKQALRSVGYAPAFA